jgi:structural maintenance of chromosome 1
MGKLIRLELFNFKSYKGHHSLLFGDAYFTSIIGPNGSGKSNAMDAISFVLGIKSSHLRSTHLKELVYRGRVLRKSTVNGEAETNGVNQVNGTQERNDPKSAWVMAVYEDDAGDEQKWKRTITSQGVSEYRLNERVVTAQQYNESLEQENILIKARNFLVFQGDVEAIAIQKPQDLTRLIEQVSGSIEHKAAYDQLQTESEAAAEQQTYQLNRRRGINSEIRQYQEQKREADKFLQKANERDEAIVTHTMWKLYHLQRQIEESSAEIQKFQNELKEYQRGIDKYTKTFDSAKQEYAKQGKEVSRIEKNIKTKEREIDESNSSLVPIDEQISVSNKQLNKYHSRISTIQKERKGQADNVGQLEKDLKVVNKAQEQWQAKWDQTSGRQGGQLSAAALQQYNKLREEVNKRASADQSRVERLKNDRAPLEATFNNLKNSVESTEFKLKCLETEYSNINERKTAVNETVQQTQAEIDAKKKELNAATSRRMQAARTKTELEEKLQEVLRKLVEADDGRRASQKEIHMKETVAMLKRTYPGVKGRVHELCRPKQKKFEEAVSTVLGRHFDALVVDTEATAKQCIEYLRDHRSGQATFIPLDTIQVKAVNPNLKGMHRGMRPAIETVDYGADVSRAISYACGNAIVCDTLDIAKELCYGRKLDVKAVTLDGSVIHKGGLMTGGRGKESGSRRWDDAEISKFEKLKDKLLADMEALPQERSRIAEEQSLQTDLVGLESRLRFAKEELDALNKNLQSKKKEVDHAKSQLKEDRPKMKSEQNKLEKIDEDISDYSDSVIQVEDEVFADFCKQNGFDDIRDYEARQGSLQQEAAKKKLEFVTQKARLEGQLTYEKKRLESTDGRIHALQEKEQHDRETIDALNEQKTGIQDDLEMLKEELDELNAQLDAARQKHEQAADVLNKHKAEIQKRSKEMESTLKSISALEGDLQRHSSSRYAVLRKCKIENIDIPVTDDSAAIDTLPINDLSGAGDVDETVDETDEVSSSALKAHRTTDYGIEPDFDALDEDLRDQSNAEVEASLLDAISKLNTTLDKMQPNSHAAQRLTTVEQRFRDTEKEFEDSRTLYREKKKAFEDVQRNRNDLFNKAFSHISEQIEPIYANLTRSAEFTAGGRAYLTADTEEPYLAGVNYHTMPPAKRFRDMEHLSGGEKTMAALALLFAIHSYQPSPFFVLDEVDAALDNANVSKLVNYVRGHAGPGMQFIVISLKTGFFQGSEALVGVYRDQGGNSSRCLTLDVSYCPSLCFFGRHSNVEFS